MTTTLLASAARTSNGTQVLPGTFDHVLAGLFLLDVTAAAAAAGDKLDVFLQSSIDGGTTWNDFVRFTQVLGNGGAVAYVGTWQPQGAAETEMGPQQDGTMAAGVVQNIQASTWRLKWIVTDAGAHAQSFTFSVSADLKRGPRQ